MHDLVNGISCYAGLDSCSSNVEHFAGKAADFAHAFLLLLVEYGDIVATEEAIPGVAICGVVGMLDGLGNSSLR